MAETYDVGKGTGRVDDEDLENRLRKKAEEEGVGYDDSDLQGILRNISYDNGGSSLESALQSAFGRYEERATNPDGEEDWEEHPEYNPANQQGSGTNNSRSAQSWAGQGAPAPVQTQTQAYQGPDYSPLINQQNELLRQLFERQTAEASRVASEQAAKEAELKTRRDSLYEQLQARAQQSLNIDPNDPIIKAQVDNYRAEQERAFRNVRSDAAESKNPLRPTQDRMAGERVAQSVASLQSELMARELTSRRSEIVGALSGMGGILTEDQQAGLQRELANLDNMIRQQQVNISGGELDLSRELGLGRLGLDTELGRGNLDLGQGRLSLDTELGRGQLSLDQLRNELLNRQFYADLGLRQQGLNSQNDQFAARLGFDTADRGSYWDWIRSGGTL